MVVVYGAMLTLYSSWHGAMLTLYDSCDGAMLTLYGSCDGAMLTLYGSCSWGNAHTVSVNPTLTYLMCYTHLHFFIGSLYGLFHLQVGEGRWGRGRVALLTCMD